MTLDKIRALIEELNRCGVGYCHWKSNYALPQSLLAETDLDLLVQRGHGTEFKAILGRLDFRPAARTDGHTFPSTEHYYAMDEGSGALIHVHAYYRVITGESLTKTYCLPVEPMLLEQSRELDSVRVPSKEAEFVIFTVRMMLKHTSLVELLLLRRSWAHVRREVAWLTAEDPYDGAAALAELRLPGLDRELFLKCARALCAPAGLYRRVVLARRMRKALRAYARQPALSSRLDGVRKLAAMLWRRARRSRRPMTLTSGGALIAVVGAEATGKTTVLSETTRWLGKHLAVEARHVGKPKSTILTILPNLLLPLLRRAMPAHRTTTADEPPGTDEKGGRPAGRVSLPFAIRSVLLAYDRRALIHKASRLATQGTIVLCDRYPSSASGAPDSARLAAWTAGPNGGSSIRRLLARVEARLYREIPAPHRVILLHVPLEVAVARNRTRDKVEPEDYVRRRHARSSGLDFGETPVSRIDTARPKAETILEVKTAIWNSL